MKVVCIFVHFCRIANRSNTCHLNTPERILNMKTGFDNQKYLKLQSEKIRERIAKL